MAMRSDYVNKYRKKPVVIDAMQYTGENFDEIEKFTSGVSLTERVICEIEEEIAFYEGGSSKEKWLEIETLEGTMIANVDDWIIVGIQGEFYPCKPDIFEKTYEKV